MLDTFVWVFLALMSAFFASLVAIFGKLALSTLDALVAATMRSLIVTVLLFLFLWMGNKTSLIKSCDAQSMWFVAASAVCGALSWLAYFLALKIGMATKVAAIDRVSIIFLICLSTFLGESLTIQSLGGAFLMCLGSLLIVYS
jgi:bacterial/archaeal transporter family protein